MRFGSWNAAQSPPSKWASRAHGSLRGSNGGAGATARKAMDFFKDSSVKLIVVPHQFGFRRKVNPFPPEMVKSLRDSGHEVHFGTMLFHTNSLYESSAPILMANGAGKW